MAIAGSYQCTGERQWKGETDSSPIKGEITHVFPTKPRQILEHAVDYRKLHQGVAPIAAAMPDVVSGLELINTASYTWYGVTDLANAFFSIRLRKKDQKPFTFTRNRQEYLLTVLSQDYVNHPLSEGTWTPDHLMNKNLSLPWVIS